MIEVYKLLSGKYDEEVSNLLLLHRNIRPVHSTRGNSKKLFKRKAYHNLCKYSFCHRVVDLWNSLPDEVILAPSVISFERRLDKHWRDLVIKYDFDLALSSTQPLPTFLPRATASGSKDQDLDIASGTMASSTP